MLAIALPVCGLVAALAAVITSSVDAAPPDKVDVIIAFKRPPTASDQALVRGLGGAIKGTYRIVPAMAATVPSVAIQGLQRNPNVERVESDIAVFAYSLNDGEPAEYSSAWGVDRLDARVVHLAGNTGAGVGIAICDTGSGPHSDLDPNVAGRYNCLSGACSLDPGQKDGNGHGTHVAGSALAKQNGSGVVGMAPDASLYSFQVLNSSGSGSFSNIIAALDYIVSYNASLGIRVANFSLGSSSDPGLTVKQAFDNAYAAGVLCIAAAGNSGNPPGKGDNVGYPARYPSVVAVAATDQNDRRASFSSTGSAVDLSAPGVAIRSTWLNGGLNIISGTSMATPHVTGAAALVFASGVVSDTDGLYGTANEVRKRLEDTALSLGSAGWYGKGLVNPAAACGVVNNTRF
jgi:subtilisin